MGKGTPLLSSGSLLGGTALSLVRPSRLMESLWTRPTRETRKAISATLLLSKEGFSESVYYTMRLTRSKSNPPVGGKTMLLALSTFTTIPIPIHITPSRAISIQVMLYSFQTMNLPRRPLLLYSPRVRT